MENFTFQSHAEQVAAHLRTELSRGRWCGSMPGVLRLAEDLGVDHKTIMAAMHLLEVEGVLVGQGAGKRRKIAIKRAAMVPTCIAILHYDMPDASLPELIQLRNALKEAGHTPVIPDKNLQDLKMDVRRVAELVRSVEADAWIVVAGSVNVLRWFAAHPVPAIAWCGRMEGQNIAGVMPDKSEAVVALVRHLFELGHRRMVMLARTERRLPEPGRSEQAFLDALACHGIQTGRYNLPEWSDSADGFQDILTSLFQLTPPTALVMEEAFLFAAAQQFLVHRGLKVPGDVSLICTDSNPTFAWCQPTIAHIGWDTRSAIRRVIHWAANVRQGKEDVRQTFTPATFVDGGTVGKVKGS